MKEITYHEWHRRRGNRADALDLTEEEIAGGQKNVCPMRWTKGEIEALHKGIEAYMMGIDGGCKPPSNTCTALYGTALGYIVGQEDKGEANWDVRDYTV